MKKASRFVVQRGWKIMLADMGLNTAHVLALAGLPADLFSRKDAALSPADYFRLWEGLEQIAGTEELPLMVGRAISVESFDPAIFASLCSPDMNTALQRLARFKPLIGPMTIDVKIGREVTCATLNCYGYTHRIPRSLGAAELVFFTQLIRLATRERIVPTVLELPELPGNSAPYTEYFENPIRRDKAIRIGFSAADAGRPFLTEDASMWNFFETELKQRLSDLEAETTFSQRVKSALLEMLPSGESTIEEAARRLAVSKRTLQRQLSRESSSYQEVLNITREALAKHYLSRSAISPPEISFLLGYQDSNSFLRAFKGWTGATPGEYRNEHFQADQLH
ncbi:AraC family transcriptional regulator [Desulfoluna spongiiphila]|uniref:AraC-type DNA-binding protein n=1 Tax=Desulfoluna spongiiphila TaxID=419481 RepID=A0A1G5FLW5_9BACT|nr:AraC family transcriptional regulator [Desulfoluna spongiiphila]SCY40151.1 AraC-type DNA-binding protein [Desulfoluna spongiiphila]